MKTQITSTLTLATLAVLHAAIALPLRAAASLTPGSLDPTFNANTNGFAYGTYPVWALALDAQGRVYVTGEFSTGGTPAGPGLVRLSADGAWDQTFRPPWTGTWRGRALAIQSDQRLLVAQRVQSGGAAQPLSRLNSDGSLDGSFPNGSYSANDVVLQPDGRILIFARYSAARLFSDGSRDWSFSPSLPSSDETYLTELALQPNGGILLCGSSDIGLQRYHAAGNRDYAFNSQGITYANLCVQPDSRILVGRSGSLARLNAAGGWDSTFTTATFTGDPTAIVVQPDGRIVAAITQSGASRGCEIYRFYPNGTRDYSFYATVEWPTYPQVLAMALQPDGRILIGGRFSSVNGIAAANLARLNGDYVPVLRVLGRPGPAGFPIELSGGPSQRYAIEVSSNLITWSVAGYVTNNSSGTCCFTNAPAPLAGQRFYRARRAP